MNLAAQIIKEIELNSNPAKAIHLMHFFKTGKGEYGEGDIFLGLGVPQVRAIVKKYKKSTSLPDIQILLQNPHHEVRTVAVLLLVEKFSQAKIPLAQKEIVDFYIHNMPRINNWDLVDISAHKILGAYCCQINDFCLLDNLAESNHLWSERAAIVANWYIIKQGNFELVKKFAIKFINHPSDLIHKATGWMLRELGKKDLTELLDFLDVYADKLPRTALRYSLEKLSPEQRSYYMKLKK